MSLSGLKTCWLLIAGITVIQSVPARGESLSFPGGSFELTPAAGGFVLDHVMNTTGQAVNHLHLELGYTNLFGESKLTTKNFSFEKLGNGEAFKPSALFGVTLFYGPDGMPNIENPAYDASKTYWSIYGNRINAP
jgi:hypothetical protein